jgi:hypothetical protein
VVKQKYANSLMYQFPSVLLPGEQEHGSSKRVAEDSGVPFIGRDDK